MFGLEISTLELILGIILILSEGLGADKGVEPNGVLGLISGLWRRMAGKVTEKKEEED